MEVCEFLEAHVYNRLQEIAKHIVTNIVVPWIFEVFVSFDYFQCLSQKKTARLTMKKAMEAVKEER